MPLETGKDPVVESGGSREAKDIDVLIQGFSSFLAAHKKKPKTIKEYTRDVTDWANWFRRPPEFFKIDEWDDWTAYLSGPRKLTGLTIGRHRTSLRRFFKYLRRRKIVDHDPSDGSEAVETIKKRPQIIPAATVELMRQKAKPGLEATILVLLYDCGMRISEARDLTWDRIGDEYIEVIGKGSKTRSVPIDATIKAQIQRIPLSVCEDTVRRKVRRLAKLVGYTKRVYPHLLRHCRATHMLNESVDLRFIQEFLGHEDIESTTLYTHVAKEELRRVMFGRKARAPMTVDAKHAEYS